MEENKNVPQVSAEEILKEKLKDVMETTVAEESIKNNNIEFDYNNITYRIKRPTTRIRLEVNEKKLEKYISYMSDKKYKMEEDLKAMYLEKGIDIEAMNKEFMILEGKKKTLQMKLGEMLKSSAPPESELKQLKEEIDLINNEQYGISIRKNSLLEFSLENQLLIFTYSYLTYLMSERKDGDNWVPVWKSYDDFLDSEEGLVNKAAFFSTLILRDL